MAREYINQSEAGRRRGVSRQRISELVAKGRFTTPVNEQGELVKGAVYVDELESLVEGKRGRPSLSQEEREKRGLDLFKLGDIIVWNHKPRDGYGFSMSITAKVVKIGLKRILVEFKDGSGVDTTAWVNKDLCNLLARPTD